MRATKSTDYYRTILILLLVIQGCFCLYIGYEASENFSLYNYLKSAKPFVGPVKNEVISMEGTPQVTPLIPHTAENSLEIILNKVFRIENILFCQAAWKHSEKHGKNTNTYTDRRVVIFHNFSINTGGDSLLVIPANHQFFSLRKRKFSNSSGLQSFNNRATWVDMEIFNPKTIHAVGVCGATSSGKTTISGDRERRLVFSEIPIPVLTREHFYTIILQVLVLGYFLSTFFMKLQKPLKKLFERDQNTYYIFESTGGPEYWAVTFFVLYMIGGLVFFLSGKVIHLYETDRKFALLTLGFVFLVHVSREIEYFHLANKRNNSLYLVSRNWFTYSVTKVVPLDQLKNIRMHVVTGSKGKKSYYLVITHQGRDYYLTDSYSNPDELEVIQVEFLRFLDKKLDLAIAAEEEGSGEGDIG